MVLVIRLDDILCGRKKGWMIFCVVDSKIGGRRELQRGLKSSSKSLWCSGAISLLLCGRDDDDDDEVNGRLDGGGQGCKR